MAKTTASKRAKGTRLEKEISKRIERALKDQGIHARRMPMSGAIEGFKGDIYTNLPIVIEVKNQEKWHIPKWWEQAKAQAGARTPVLMFSRNNDPEILCTMEIEDFLWIIDYAIRGGWK